MTLYVSYHNDKDRVRDNEIQYALQKNLENKHLKKIVLVTENVKITYPKHDKLSIHVKEQRPTYNDFFELATDNKDELFIIANDDIYFDETIKAAEWIGEGDAIALARHEEHTRKICDIPFGSQDVWIFRTPMKEVQGDFALGMPGCDNRIAHEIRHAGYNVYNPCLTIKAWHVHRTNLRRYNRATDTIPPPYLNVMPCAFAKR